VASRNPTKLNVPAFRENGVQLVFKSGKQLLIGSQRAEELKEAIRSIMEGD